MGRAVAEKLFVLGVDGMDPRLTMKYLKKGVLPNTQKLLDAGAANEYLGMLGGHPTVTPPMWTTLSTGAYPVTHGITGFFRKSPKGLEFQDYNLDSRNCLAEQLWNVFAEAGKKTLVFHWPGSSWPPTSDSPNLHVIDGTQPPAVNMGVAQVEAEVILVATDKVEEVCYREKAASDSNVPCVITDLKVKDDMMSMEDSVSGESTSRLVLKETDGQGMLSEQPFDVVLSPVKAAYGWRNAPADAKEFTMLFSKGTVRRVGLILKNAAGLYDHVAVYKNKNADEPLYTLANNVMAASLIDEALKNDTRYRVNRNARVLEIGQDGNYLKIWFSGAMDIHNDSVWHPKSLFKLVTENVGYPCPEAMLGGADPVLIRDCMIANWDIMADWQAKAIHLLLAEEGYEVVFSHFHNIDAEGHMIMKFLKGNDKLSQEQYAAFLEESYIQADRYIGEFLHLLDEGWAIFLVSDHGQVCPEHKPPMLLDGISVRVMQELGFTALKKDESGNDLYEIDWENTKAVNSDAHIYINLKGRDEHGIVEPADKYEVEEEIITALYGYKNKETGKRVVSLALRNKDAVVIGLGGPESGDIVLTLAEGYNYDHADALATTCGFGDTSEAPIFIMAGPGIKKGCRTKRIIREVDVAPTMAVLGGVRQPAQCEGAPVYQLLEQEIGL